MYIEFIIVYIALGILLAMQAASLIIGILAFRRSSGSTASSGTDVPAKAATGAKGGVVFCGKCFGQYSASEKKCPSCGAPRQ